MVKPKKKSPAAGVKNVTTYPAHFARTLTPSMKHPGYGPGSDLKGEHFRDSQITILTYLIIHNLIVGKLDDYNSLCYGKNTLQNNVRYVEDVVKNTLAICTSKN